MDRSINTIFCRQFLRLAHADVRKAFPQVRNLMSAASTTQPMRGHWFIEIEVPGLPRFNYDVRAGNAYEARAKAWNAFMRAHANKAA